MSLVDELAKLAELHRTGAITDAEYTQAKARLLDDVSTPLAEETTSPVPHASSPAGGQSGAPAWMRPWGWLLTWLGIVGFSASTYINWRTGRESEAMIAGLLNPMCFIGIPVGIYWLSRSGTLREINESTAGERENFGQGCAGLMLFITVALVVWMIVVQWRG